MLTGSGPVPDQVHANLTRKGESLVTGLMFAAAGSGLVIGRFAQHSRGANRLVDRRLDHGDENEVGSLRRARTRKAGPGSCKLAARHLNFNSFLRLIYEFKQFCFFGLIVIYKT